MNARRLVLFLMIVVQAVILQMMFKNLLFPVLAGGLALLGLSGRVGFHLTRRRRVFASFGILIWFLLVWRLFPYDRTDVAGSLGYRVTYTFAQYFIALQLLELFGRVPAGSAAPVTSALFAMLAMACSGNLFVSLDGSITYSIACLALTGLVVLYLRGALRSTAQDSVRPPPSKVALMAGLFAAMVVLSAVIGLVLYSNRNYLARLLLPRPPLHLAGFSTQAKLGDVMKLKIRAGDEQTALRVVSAQRPGYLRGRAFAHYAGGEWSPKSGRAVLDPSQPPPAGLPPAGRKRHYFILRRGVTGPWRRVVVWPAPAVAEGMFAPKEAAVMSAPVQRLIFDQHRVMDSAELAAGLDYTSYLPVRGVRDPLPRVLRERLTDPPRHLDPRIPKLAESIFKGCASTAEKINAVERHFHDNYRYQIGIRVPRDADPLAHFLLDRPPAHCEYFASGAAVLLRLGGVPAQYVTGFVVREWNPYGRYWMARNRDAHAWVEAYDDVHGWVIVEATPPAGVPDGAKAGALDHLSDTLNFRFLELSAATRLNGVRGLLGWLGGRAAGAWGLLVSPGPVMTGLKMALAVALLVWLLFRLKRRPQRAVIDPRLRRLHDLLARMDRRLKRHGLVRTGQETLHQFAGRILDAGLDAGLARWYTHYAAARYRGTDDGDVERLGREQVALS